MCLLRVLNVARPIIQNDVILLRYESFSRFKDEIYMRVLSSDKRDGEISKSYYYFIMEKLRQMGLLLDNAISFKAVLPYNVTPSGINLIEGIMYITNKKELIYFDIYDQTYVCGKCEVLSKCVPSLKQIAYELGIKVRSDNPNIAWYKILESIQQAILNSSLSLKLKLGEIPFGERVCCEEVEEREFQTDV